MLYNPLTVKIRMIPFVVECPELNLHMPFGTYSPKKLQHNSISPIARKPRFANYGRNPGEKSLLVKVWFRSVFQIGLLKHTTLDTPFFPGDPGPNESPATFQISPPPSVFAMHLLKH